MVIGHGYQIFFDIYFLYELLSNLLFNSLSWRVIEPQVCISTPAISCVSWRKLYIICIEKSYGRLTGGCSKFGPAVGSCGYDAMDVG